MTEFSYDQIAEVYATDMGSNMPFDDIGYYLERCRDEGGRALELGCGTGRILLPLRAAGIDISGLDRSAPMLAELQRQAGAAGIDVQTVLGDIGQLAQGERYRVVLAPYSLVTYLTSESALEQFVASLRQIIEPGGLAVIDAFVPRDTTPFDDFREDYLRAHQDGWLRREKRIAHVDHCNRIERRYTLQNAAHESLRSWITLDTVRPWHTHELVSVLECARFTIEARVGDYGQSDVGNARFVTLQARRRP